MRNIASLSRCLVVALPIVVLAASAGHANNDSRFKAFSLPDERFEIIADYSDNSIYWCGAAIYATSALSKPVTQKIYVWKTRAPSIAQPAEKSVQFGFQQPPGTEPVTSLTKSVDIVGNSLTAAQARQGCFDLLVND